MGIQAQTGGLTRVSRGTITAPRKFIADHADGGTVCVELQVRIFVVGGWGGGKGKGLRERVCDCAHFCLCLYVSACARGVAAGRGSLCAPCCCWCARACACGRGQAGRRLVSKSQSVCVQSKRRARWRPCAQWGQSCRDGGRWSRRTGAAARGVLRGVHAHPLSRLTVPPAYPAALLCEMVRRRSVCRSRRNPAPERSTVVLHTHDACMAGHKQGGSVLVTNSGRMLRWCACRA